MSNLIPDFTHAPGLVARREAAILKTGALQNAIFNSANFSSIATDEEGVIQLFNVGAEHMLGYVAGDVLDKITPADISDPDELIARAQALSVELGTPVNPGFEALVFKASRGIDDIYELTFIRKDGSRLPTVVSVTALRDGHGDIIGYLLVGTDNTARKQVEVEQKLLDQRLRDQQFYTRSLIESNVDALMTTDPRGIITDVNAQTEALTGCTRDELIGAPFKCYFTDPDRAEAGINKVLKEKKVIDYELTARARDGRETVVSYNATTFYDRDRKLQGVFASARDVTERKRLDELLHAKNLELESARAAADKANRAKSEFLSSMSHELRTPLTAILGFAELMETDAPTPSQQESLEQILKGGWYLLELINQVLDLAVIESGQLSMSMEPVALADVMPECRTMIEADAKKRGISLLFPDFQDACFVMGDRTRTKQIIVNLLSNAVKYNTQGGTVEVTVTNESERVRVSVRDTGSGLPAEKVAQLFTPFNRLGQEGSAIEGTGIGLVVTKRLVEQMGGAIGVMSEVGAGSVFWVEMVASSAPFTEGASASSAHAQGPSSDAATTVLYVEDNPANTKLVQLLIARRPGMKLVTAVTAKEGIAIARADPPTLILMDVNLPDMSGLDAMQLLHQDPATAHIPVLALTANAMPREVKHGLKAGFLRYLTKPIKVVEFMAALDVAIDAARAATVRAPQ